VEKITDMMPHYETIKYFDDFLCERHVGCETNAVCKWLKDRGRDNITYIDIGANVGKFHDVLSRKFKINHCIMIEPCKILYDYLVSKFSGKPGIEIYNIALSDINGVMSFNSDSVTHALQGGIKDSLNLGLSKLGNKGIDISVRNCFDFLVEHIDTSSDVIDLIKIDTENRDYNILKVLVPFVSNLKDKPIICFEHNYHNDIEKDVASKILYDFTQICNYQPVDFDKLHGDSFLLPNI
jgi:FkbM family methyltransferase